MNERDEIYLRVASFNLHAVLDRDNLSHVERQKLDEALRQIDSVRL